ncbi:hypothetical protein EMCG_00453 [[Emmonsia] crescens]|uniref:Uncharacterized protein n=1 Tax=[Emmonsia] crescens TaxID=73230 RepID=A0A0G2J0F3_9EURO|nr:hypothetical protein EMCG_00453 [Emmonsia crescens UAMH 3008]
MELFYGPLQYVLHAGVIVDHHRRILGYRFLQDRSHHWSWMLRDRSSPHDPRQAEDRRNHFLKSELMAVTAMMYRQMNAMVWIPKEDNYRARMRYKHGLLTLYALGHGCELYSRESTCGVRNLQSIRKAPEAESHLHSRYRDLRQEYCLQSSPVDPLSA